MKVKSLLLASAMLAGLPTLAYAEPTESWYVGVGAGANWGDDQTGILTNSVGATTGYALEFDTGWIVAGSVGYHWDMARLELELGYRDNDVSGFAPGPSSGSITHFSQMLNLIFDIPLGESIELSLGGGIGGSLVDSDITGTLLGADAVIDDDDYVFAYQGLAGLSFDVGERTELFAEYRYFVTDEAQLAGSFSTGVTFSTSDFETENHSGLIGLRYYFGEEEVVAPVDDTPPPPPQTNFTIYFNKKGALTSDAQATIQ